MIDDNFKQKIIATLGKQYTGDIIQHLAGKEIFDSKGKSYSSGSLRNIVCGIVENETVETAILDLVVEKTKEKIKVQKKIKQL